jgi:putative nucleotidyltransferase with HDIG domain
MGAKIAAIVLAAGYSSRMGEFKPLLPLGDTTVLERVVALFKDAGIEDVRVVVGHRSPDLLPLLERLHAHPLLNDRYQDGMFSSVVTGVRGLEPDTDAFFLLPVDIPLVKKHTVEILLREYPKDRSRIIYPGFFGKRGHPPLIPGCHREGILAWHGEGGLKSYLARYDADAMLVEVADETILADMDTPEDYHRLCAMWQRREIPTVRECDALLHNVLHCEKRLLDHSRAVARLALLLTENLNGAGCSLDPDLVAAAALLHDLAKGQRDHAYEGARILREMGYPVVADIVACHMNISLNEREDIEEKEIIYVADKMISGNRFVPIEDRFRSRLDSLETNGNMLQMVEWRLRNAQRIRKRVEKQLGRPLDEVLKNFRPGSELVD